MQVPIVATRAAMEGLDPLDGRDCLLAETPYEFGAQIARVLGDDRLTDRLAEEGRARVETAFAWRVIGEKLRELYRDIAAGSAQTT
jgi:glycosyltransferase involved in cell wall biosynthesis